MTYRWNTTHSPDISNDPDLRRYLDLQKSAHNDMVDILVEKTFGTEDETKNTEVAHNIIRKAQKQTQNWIKTLFPGYSLSEADTLLLHISAQKDMVYFLAETTTDGDTAEAEVLARKSYRKIQSAITETQEVLQHLIHTEEQTI